MERWEMFPAPVPAYLIKWLWVYTDIHLVARSENTNPEWLKESREVHFDYITDVDGHTCR